MKIFDSSFFAGIITVAAGVLLIIIGILSLLPPSNGILLGLILLFIGCLLAVFGQKTVKGLPPSREETARSILDKSSTKRSRRQ